MAPLFGDVKMQNEQFSEPWEDGRCGHGAGELVFSFSEEEEARRGEELFLLMVVREREREKEVAEAVEKLAEFFDTD